MVAFQVHHRMMLRFDGCHGWKSSLVQVGCCEGREDVQSFPAEVGKLPSRAHRKFYTPLARKLNFLKIISDIMSIRVLLQESEKFVILGRISIKLIRDPFIFITYCLWKIHRQPGLQINQVMFDTLINSTVTCFHSFFHKILQTGKHIQTFPF
jgi:hypothetical protein